MQSGIRVSTEPVASYRGTLPRLTWIARLAAAWAAAGATAGGALIALLILAGRMHPGGSAAPALLLAITGGTLGFIHGAVLGRLSRGSAPPAGFAAHVLGAATGAAALLAASALAVWLTTSAVLARAGELWGWLALLAGAAAAAAIAVLATYLGWIALERAWSTWRERRLGIFLIAGSFVVLAAVLLVLEPALPGGRGRLTTMGWLLVAALATLWIAMPVVILALRAGGAHRK